VRQPPWRLTVRRDLATGSKHVVSQLGNAHAARASAIHASTTVAVVGSHFAADCCSRFRSSLAVRASSSLMNSPGSQDFANRALVGGTCSVRSAGAGARVRADAPVFRLATRANASLLREGGAAEWDLSLTTSLTVGFGRAGGFARLPGGLLAPITTGRRWDLVLFACASKGRWMNA
jgi:hypothetical protein